MMDEYLVLAVRSVSETDHCDEHEPGAPVVEDYLKTSALGTRVPRFALDYSATIG